MWNAQTPCHSRIRHSKNTLGDWANTKQCDANIYRKETERDCITEIKFKKVLMRTTFCVIKNNEPITKTVDRNMFRLFSTVPTSFAIDNGMTSLNNKKHIHIFNKTGYYLFYERTRFIQTCSPKMIWTGCVFERSICFACFQP